jgi:tRNA pseudouridine38-40 synthase
VSTTVRTIVRSEISRAPEQPLPDTGSVPDLLMYEVEGDGFLRHMVRAIVGTLVDVGRGARSVSSVAALLDGGAERGQAGATAPAHGLYLVGVDYD